VPFHGIEPKTSLWIERLKNHRSLIHTPLEAQSLGQERHNAIGEVSMDIEQSKSGIVLNVLTHQVFDEIRFAIS
jgi:hypothetical protein